MSGVISCSFRCTSSPRYRSANFVSSHEYIWMFNVCRCIVVTNETRRDWSLHVGVGSPATSRVPGWSLRRLVFNLRVLVLTKKKVHVLAYGHYTRHVLVVSCPCQLDLRFKVGVANQRAAQSRLTKAIALIGRWSGGSLLLE